MRALAGLQDSSVNPVFKDCAQERAREPRINGRGEFSASLGRQKGIFQSVFPSCHGGTSARPPAGSRRSFLRLFHHLEFQDFMRGQVKSALRYPTFVVVAMAIAMVIINVFVIPAFAKVYRASAPSCARPRSGLIGFFRFHGGRVGRGCC